MPSLNVKEIEKLILDPDHHQNLITSRGSPLSHAYHVWSKSINAFMIYPAYRQTQTNSSDHITPPWRSTKYAKYRPHTWSHMIYYTFYDTCYNKCPTAIVW